MAINKRYTVAEFAQLQGWNEEFVRQMCRQQPDARTGNKYILPPGWEAQKFGRDWFIYRVSTRSKTSRYPSGQSSDLRVSETARSWQPLFDFCEQISSTGTPIVIELSCSPTAKWSLNLKDPADEKLAKKIRKLLP